MKRDVILIGAGPIGIEMATVLTRAGISYYHLEAEAIGATITRWPRNTRFFSSPEWIALAGVPIQTAAQEIPTGEEYLAYLRSLVEQFNLEIRTYERVTAIEGEPGAFHVTTRTLAGGTNRYKGRRIILATGDMNHTRSVGIPGEDLPHVTHLWEDPHRYFQRKLLIIGGRNSAVEAAIRCWRAGASVALSYRGAYLDEKRLISRLHLEVDLLIRNGQIDFYPNTVPVAIHPGTTRLRSVPTAHGDESGAVSDTAPPAHTAATPTPSSAGVPGAGEFDVAADFVYLATGFTMDRALYEACGISMEGEERRPVFDAATMESNAPGVYVVGTACGGDQRGYTVFITTSHAHCLAAARSIADALGYDATTIADEWVGNHAARDYPLSSADVE